MYGHVRFRKGVSYLIFKRSFSNLSRMKKIILLGLALGISAAAQGQGFFTWTADQGDFYTASNWDLNRIPGVNDVVIINNGGTATIAADAGDRALSGFELGELEDTDDSGHIIMNGGFLRIGESPGDSKIHIGEGDIQSTFVMNGGTIFFDGPDDSGLAGSRDSAGVNENDWEVGEHGVGRFEMHGDSVFRAGDDLKISENAAGTGSALIDGNARLSVGSGIAVSSGGTSVQELIIGGNAVVDSGNSMGAGSPDGHTDEGYLTLAIGGGNAKVVVQESGTLNFRVLSSRQGITEFTVKDSGQVHIFDVMAGKGGSAEERPVQEGGFRSSLSSGAETESTLLLQDNAVMTVNAENGIGISGPRGSSDAGGQAIMIVRDSASFRVEQYFALGTGSQSETSDGTLEIRGPDASVYIGENFNMAVDPEGAISATDTTNEDGTPVPGKSTLSAVITSSSHGIVEVGGIARIAQGILKVSLDGYTPRGGETYTLIQGGTVEGEFRELDFSGAELADGLSWEVQYAADKVSLHVDGQSSVGGTTTLSIDSDGDQLTLSWEDGGTLYGSPSIKGPWTAIDGASSPYSVTAGDAAGFYRVGQGGQTVSVVLSGSQEVPAVASTGTGSGTLTVSGTTLSIHIRYSGLESNFAAAHIHGPAERGSNAGVLVPLSTPNLHTADGNTAGTFSGTVEISAETAAAILEGRAYVNIHTSGNGGGEIRGQTMP